MVIEKGDRKRWLIIFQSPILSPFSITIFSIQKGDGKRLINYFFLFSITLFIILFPSSFFNHLCFYTKRWWKKGDLLFFSFFQSPFFHHLVQSPFFYTKMWWKRWLKRWWKMEKVIEKVMEMEKVMEKWWFIFFLFSVTFLIINVMEKGKIINHPHPITIYFPFFQSPF